MRIRTALVFIFIFLVWYAIYQMFFSLIINVAFVLSIAAVIWLVRKVKSIKGWFKPKEQKKLFLRRANT